MSSGASMSSIFSRFGAQTSGGSNPVTPPTAPSASSTSPAANQEIAELRKELASRDARISTLLDEKDEFKAEISRLSHHLATLLNNASSPAPGQSNTNQTLSSDPLAAAGPAGSVSLASLDKLKEENEDLKNKLQVAKDKVLFHNVDKLEQDNRRLKSENTSLRQELDELRVIRSKHQEVVDAEKARYEDLMKAFANAVEIKKALEKNLLEANSKILDLERVVEDKSREQEKLELEIEKSRSSLNSVNLQLNERMAEKLREVEADHAMKVQEMKDMVEKLETSNNYLNQKVASQKKDLRKLLRTSDTKAAKAAFLQEFERMEMENQRLKEELERKTKSLQNALEALHPA